MCGPFDAAGMGQTLGLIDDVSNAEIATAVTALLQDGARRRQMRKVGQQLFGATAQALRIWQAVRS